MLRNTADDRARLALEEIFGTENGDRLYKRCVENRDIADVLIRATGEEFETAAAQLLIEVTFREMAEAEGEDEEGENDEFE